MTDNSQVKKSSTKIYGIGIAAADIVNETLTFPAEDSEARAVKQTVRRGGNATNTLVVLSQLGHQCEWIGTLTDDLESQVITSDLDHHIVSYHQAEKLLNHKTPTSYITLNQATGSRTIVHYRDLPELSFKHFSAVNIENPAWIHIEGRNVDQTEQVLYKIRKNFPQVPLSIEIEKQREHLEKLFNLADIYLFSRHFAQQMNFNSAEALLTAMRNKNPSSLLVCTWGADGAFALEGEAMLSASAPKINVIDSIGAGDVFNAAFIHAKLTGFDTQDSLEYACQTAAIKCQQHGIDKLFP